MDELIEKLERLVEALKLLNEIADDATESYYKTGEPVLEGSTYRHLMRFLGKKIPHEE